MPARIDRYAAFFRELDVQFAGPTEISQESLFLAFGAEGLRRAYKPVAYLVETLGVVWSASLLEDLNEHRRIDQMLAGLRPHSWCEDLEEYRAWLVAPPSQRRQLTVRTYLNAARQLMLSSGCETLSEVSNDVLHRFLRRHRGHATSLSPFIRFANETRGSQLKHVAPRRTDTGHLEKAAIRSVRRCLDVLASNCQQRKKVAFAATLLSKLYQLPRKTVLSLSQEAVVAAACDAKASLVVDGQHYALDTTVADALNSCLANSRPDARLFPGRSHVASLSSSAVWHHIKEQRQT